MRRILEVLEGLEVRYMLTGSWASMAYGEPRMTQDIDVVAELKEEQVPQLCRCFPQPEYYLSEEAARQAVRSNGQFNIIHGASGNKVDIVMARDTPWGFSEIRRRRRHQVLPDLEGYIASPEDVIIAKMVYCQEVDSEKHTRDCVGILKTSPDLVDKAYVEKWAKELGLEGIWRVVLERAKEKR